MATLYLISALTAAARLFFKAVFLKNIKLYHFIFLSAVYEGSTFSTSLTTLIFIYLFGSNHLSGYEVVFYCSRDLYLPDGLSTFLLVYLLWRNVYSNSVPILNCLLIIELHVFFLYSRYKSLSNYMVCNYFLLFCQLFFHFLDDVLCSTNLKIF